MLQQRGRIKSVKFHIFEHKTKCMILSINDPGTLPGYNNITGRLPICFHFIQRQTKTEWKFLK